MISADSKLFEEVDKPESSRIVSEDNGNGIIERESSWTGQIRGINSFPSGTAKGHGNSMIYKNGISISNWQGIFTTDKGAENILCSKGCKQKRQILCAKDMVYRRQGT